MTGKAKNLSLILAAFLTLLYGCATYHPEPIDGPVVGDALKPPEMEVIRIKAGAIRHPILRPVDFDLRNGLSPDEAAVMAVIANPALRAVRDLRGVAGAQLIQAGILPNPRVSYNLDIPTGGDKEGAVNGYGFGIGWDIRSLITRSARMDAARAHAASVDLDIAWQEWQVAESAKLHLFRLFYLDRQRLLTKKAEQRFREVLKAVKESVASGERTVTDLAVAEVALQQAHASVLTTEKAKERERLALNRTLGIPPDRIIPVQRDISLPSWRSLPSEAEIMKGLEGRRLDLLALKMGYGSREASVRAAILSQFPGISIGLNNARDTGRIITTGFEVSIDLPFFDRNQGRIAVERATRRRVFDEYITRLFEARSEVAVILSDMKSLKKELSATAESLPVLKNLTQTYRRALQQGSTDFMSYYRVQNELTAKQIKIVKLRQVLSDMGIALEVAAGEYLPVTKGASPALPAKIDNGKEPE
jgi:outer membrane protein TolC